MKRVFDVVMAVFLLMALAPLLIVTALLVLLATGRPVFFVQERPGLGGKPFRMIKFRTMSFARGNDGKLLPDDRRLGLVGRFLRASSLDEAPELINVLLGDMSLVGPRPLLMEYLPLYSPEQARRHAVRPGITGWAQVKGRNRLTWDEKFAFDIWYVDNRTMLLDLKILAMTIAKVFSRDGISQEGHATMPVFTGRSRDS